MFFLFLTELSLILVIVYTGLHFHDANLDMKANYENSGGFWLFYIPKLMPPSLFDSRVIFGIKIGILVFTSIFVVPLFLLLFVQCRNF